MSKYIIEIEEKPLCVFDKDTQTYFPRLWRVKGFNSLVFDEEGLSRLEELNSDYINEHYGELQDEAYQKGFEDGKWKAEDGCDGCKYYEDTSLTNPCSECSRGHVDHYKPASDPDRIEVGGMRWRFITMMVDRIRWWLSLTLEMMDILMAWTAEARSMHIKILRGGQRPADTLT